MLHSLSPIPDEHKNRQWPLCQEDEVICDIPDETGGGALTHPSLTRSNSPCEAIGRVIGT